MISSIILRIHVPDVDVHLVYQLTQFDFHVVIVHIFPVIIIFVVCALLESILVLVFILDLRDRLQVRLLVEVDAAAHFRVRLQFVDECYFILVDHAVVVEAAQFELLLLLAFEVAFDQLHVLVFTGFEASLFDE